MISEVYLVVGTAVNMAGEPWSHSTPDSLYLSHWGRPPQDVDVLAVLDFQIPCFRPETPALYIRSLLTNLEGRGRKLGRPRWL